MILYFLALFPVCLLVQTELRRKLNSLHKMNIFLHGIGPIQITKIIWDHLKEHLKSCGLDFTLIDGQALLAKTDPKSTDTEKFVPIWRALRDAQGRTIVCTDGCLQNPLHVGWMHNQGLLGSNALAFSVTHDRGDVVYASIKHDIREAIKATGVRHIALKKTPSADDAAAETIMRFQSFYDSLIREGQKRRRYHGNGVRPLSADEHRPGRHLSLVGF